MSFWLFIGVGGARGEIKSSLARWEGECEFNTGGVKGRETSLLLSDVYAKDRKAGGGGKSGSLLSDDGVEQAPLFSSNPGILPLGKGIGNDPLVISNLRVLGRNLGKLALTGC